MPPVIDCPHCDTRASLEVVAVEAQGTIVAYCCSCAKHSRFSPTGAVLEPIPVTDVSGTVIDGP